MSFARLIASQNCVCRAYLTPSLCFFQVPCGIFDDPAIVAEIKQASETIRKAMVQSNDLHSGLTAANSAQELNQMVSIVHHHLVSRVCHF